MSIRKRLIVSFLILFVLFFSLDTYLIIMTWDTETEITEIKNQSLKTALLSDELKLHIVEVQQWLTDISATRGQNGLDNGFNMANMHANHFYKAIKELKGINPDKASLFDSLKTSFDTYYSTGKDMAKAYIDGGPEKGNLLMGSFDKASENLNQEIDTYRDESISEINSEIEHTYGEMVTMFWITLITSAVLLIISIILPYRIYKSIDTPLQKLMDSTDQISKGNLVHPIQIKSKDEIGKLANSFEMMRQNLFHLIKEIVSMSNSLSESSKQLAASSGQSGESINQMTITINEIAEGGNKQSEKANFILNKMKDTVKDVENGDRQLDATVTNAKLSTQVAYEGKEIISESIDSLNTVVHNVSNATTSIQELGMLSEEIGGIINLITDISEQTNLLALNASIEAARAGEHGRGFAVVADEVRKLAEESNGAASKITGLINNIQVKTSSTVQTMEKNVSLVENQLSLIQKGGESLTEIVNKAHDTEKSVNDLKDVIQKIKNNANEVLQSIENISNIIEESAASSEEVAATAEEQSATVEEITASSDELSMLAIKLQEKIKSFKVE